MTEQSGRTTPRWRGRENLNSTGDPTQYQKDRGDAGRNGTDACGRRLPNRLDGRSATDEKHRNQRHGEGRSGWNDEYREQTGGETADESGTADRPAILTHRRIGHQ